MVAPREATVRNWGELAVLEASAREAAIQARYNELLGVPDEKRRDLMLSLVREEYALPDDRLRAFTVSRLNVWLRMDQQAARTIAAAYDTAMRGMPGVQAMRRVSLVQTLAREYSPEDRERLVTLVPNVFAGSSVGSPLPMAVRFPSKDAAKPMLTPKRPKWWPFGRPR
jgi:hypothetical protein